MAGTLASRLIEPISEAEPCGPDLDLDFDPDYSQFVARAEGVLPDSFFTFVRAEAKLPEECRATEQLLERTRDLRLLVLLAKFRVLNREIGPCAEALEAIRALLAERWDDVHPRGEDGDYGLRVAVLEALDDTKHVILPLQHAPLVLSRRSGSITYRAFQIASGDVVAREGEDTIDLIAIDTAFNDAELAAVVASRDLIVRIQSALTGIRESVAARGDGATVSFDKLEPAVVRIRALLDSVVQRRDPMAAPPPDEAAPDATGLDGAAGEGAAAGPPPAPVGLATTAELRAALQRVETYFQQVEPSSPALLLVAQARQLVGKTLAESVQALIPSYASEAVIQVGGRQVFELPIERLASLIESGEEREGGDDPAEPPPPIQTRRDALALLQQIGAHVRSKEPSSPIPLLCERAKVLAERDFLSLLREMLPNSAFRNLDES